jgi:signal transduction histidine kinase
MPTRGDGCVGREAISASSSVDRRVDFGRGQSHGEDTYAGRVVRKPAQLQGRPMPWQRALVPGDWYESSGSRSASDWLVDGAVFALAALVGVLALAHIWDSRSTVVDALDVVFGSVACLALWFRRSRPLAVLLVAASGVVFALALGAALAAIFNTAVRGRGRTLVIAVLLALAGSIVFPLVNPGAGPVFRQRFPGFMLSAIAFGWGLFVRVRRELIVSLRERADRLEAEQEQRDELAREAERRRIAREMHDVLAHRLSLLSIHAGALEFRPSASPAEIAQAAAVIRTSAAAALDELHDVIMVLREDTASGTAAPQPTLVQLPDLLEESRAAGMDLHTHLDMPDADTLPAALGRTAYRVVQEGLTNARKHSPGAAVDVAVSVNCPDGVIVEVISHPSRAGINKMADPSLPTGAGSGLIGLAERLALVGGKLEHGLNVDGDFVLRAMVPGP